MNGKPRITPIEQQTPVRLGRDQVERKVTSPMGSALAGIGDLAQIMGQAMKERASAKEKYNEQLIRNWEEQLSNKYKALGGQLNQSQDPDEYDSIAKSALDDMKSSGKLFLGEKLYKKWEGEHGQNYYNSIGIDVDNKKQGLYQKKAYELAKDTVKQMAYNYGYAETDEEREIIHKQFREQINDKSFSPIEVLALTESFKKESSNSRLAYLVDKSPQTIASVDKDGNVISVMDDPKQYTNLTIAEKVDWKNKALRIQAARKKDEELAAKKGKEDYLYMRAAKLAESDPTSLQNEVLGAKADIFGFQQKLAEKGVSVGIKDLNSYLDFVQKKLLDDPSTPLGKQKAANFASAETAFKEFGINDGKVKTGNLDNTENLLGIINRLQAGIKNGDYSESDSKKAREYAHQAAVVLGEKLKKANNLEWNGFDGTEFLQNSISKMAKREGLLDAFAPEDLAGMYISAVQMADEQGINLSSPFKENREKLTAVWNKARTEFIAAKHGVPVDTVDAALMVGQLVALMRNPKAGKTEKMAEAKGLIDQYKAKKWNGTNLRAKQSPNGQVSVYFDEE